MRAEQSISGLRGNGPVDNLISVQNVQNVSGCHD
jgi:hypothetical protein